VRLALAVSLSAAVSLSGARVSGEEWTVASPDGRLAVTLSRSADGRLSWRASRSGAVVIADSPLGLRRADQAFTDGLKVVRASTVGAIDETYEMPHGKRRRHQVRARQWWYSSRPLEVETTPGETVRVHVDLARGRSFLQGMLTLMFTPWRGVVVSAADDA